jgi:hypothetical protein
MIVLTEGRRQGKHMRKIVVSIQNTLLAEALTNLLKESGEFEPFRVVVDKKKRTVAACLAFEADIVLMEVSQAPAVALDVRKNEIKEIQRMLPACKVVLICDENVSPQIAADVVAAKKNHEIDAFYYSSVTTKYLIAALYAL